jgi:NADH-quinone oxidoreductase subunit B
MADLSKLETRTIGGGESGFVTTKFEALLGWARKYSLFQYPFATACCGMEFFSTASPRYDIARFGMEVFRASPRQADIIIVAGRVSQKMAPVLRQVYDQMMEPKWVISMGVCASSGGMFNNYAILQGVDQIVPVDVYAPGCPPTPETLIHAIETLHQKIEDGEIMRRRAKSGAGANIHITEIPAQTSPVPVLLSRPSVLGTSS